MVAMATTSPATLHLMAASKGKNMTTMAETDVSTASYSSAYLYRLAAD
ncbi:hypothetical protein O9993_15935 [Vibrio lentus]|nr:hypothetical protein [Vibrio lentus]